MGGMIRDMASDDATVVIGTSIDPEMKDELRVTMVATGILDGSAPAVAPKMEVVEPIAKAVGSSYESMGDSDQAEPELMTRRRGLGSNELPLFDSEGESGLDVPTFLRRQAD